MILSHSTPLPSGSRRVQEPKNLQLRMQQNVVCEHHAPFLDRDLAICEDHDLGNGRVSRPCFEDSATGKVKGPSLAVLMILEAGVSMDNLAVVLYHCYRRGLRICET